MFPLACIFGGLGLGVVTLVVAIEMHRREARRGMTPEDIRMVARYRRRAETQRFTRRGFE